jgi:hypothetical protein
MNKNRLGIIAAAGIAATALGVLTAPAAAADANCTPTGGPPADATSKDVSDVYGQPATLWVSDTTVGITTAQGTGEAAIETPSPLQRSAFLLDAKGDGHHQIIVDTGREAILYVVSGCTITRAVAEDGGPFVLDIGHRRGLGDGVGCSDLGDGRHLAQLLQLRDDLDRPLMMVRRTEIDLIGSTATTGRSDTFTATSEHDPAWTSAADISCGDRDMANDGVAAHYGPR